MCINKHLHQSNMLKDQLAMEYELKIEQINRAQRDLTQRILDELSKIKQDNEL